MSNRKERRPLARQLGIAQLLGDSSRSVEEDVKDVAAYYRELSSRPAPFIDIGGYWEAPSGSILCIRKSATSSSFSVVGTAFDQKAHGEGSINGGEVAIRLTLQAERKEVDLDLRARPNSDLLSGWVRGRDGIVRDVSLMRFAPDVEGRWEQDAATFLSFSRSRLDWYDGKQQVRAHVTGSVFGRSGRGEFKLSLRWIGGSLESTDDSHREHYFRGGVLLNPNSEEWYIRECPKDGWWASKSVLIGLTMSSDGRFLDGTVKPGALRRRAWETEQPKREAIVERLHMLRRPQDPPRERSL